MNFITLVRKEILENIYNFRYGIILALSVLVISTSVFTMYRDYCLRVENYNVLQPQGNEAIAIIAPTPLSIFVKGLDDNLCQAYEVNSLGIEMGSSQQKINQLFMLFTTPDLLYIIKIVLSLCALLMAYDVITREKESGTLRHLLANPVKRPVLLLAKWLGGFISFMVPLLLVLLLLIGIVSILPMVQFTTADYGKIAVFLFFSIVYLAIFFTFGLFVSCLTRKSVTSLILSLFFWAMAVFIVPNLSNNISKQLVKNQSLEQLNQQQRLAWAKSMFEMINNHVDADTGWEHLSMAYAAEMDKQVKMSQQLANTSPAGIISLLATDVMNTGITDQNGLKRGVWEYYKVVRDAPIDSDGNLLGEFPLFQHQRSRLSETLSNNSLPILLLLSFIVLFFVGAYAAFMKYDLR